MSKRVDDIYFESFVLSFVSIVVKIIVESSNCHIVELSHSLRPYHPLFPLKIFPGKDFAEALLAE